ncbi:MAG: hypothetical protein PVS3B1_37700 [Ktedonobacteraceae bacterium]
MYQVQKLLGTGRSGPAYLAMHQRSGQPVALKLLLMEDETMDLLEAARREVRVATSLRHPSIVPVFSSTPWAPEPIAAHSPRLTRDLRLMKKQQENYLLTLCQYVPGTFPRFVAHYQQREMQRALYERGISLAALLASIIQQTGSALSATHARGIAHGALVPGNFLFASHDRVWIGDFGLARIHPPPPPYLAPELYSASHATTHGGNPAAYWRAATPTSDQYALAVICQQLLGQLLPANEYEPLLPVLQRATQQRPERRYPNLDLFIQDLLTLTQSEHASTQRGQTNGNGQQNGSGVNNANKNNVNKAYPTTPAAMLQPALPRPRGPLPSHGSRGSGQPGGPPSAQPTPQPPTTGEREKLLTPALPATPLTPAHPQSLEDWARRGDKLFTMRNYEESLQAYHRAIEIDGERPLVWLALGDTYFALERYKEALMAYEQAMYLNPDDPQAWSNRGTVLDALGRHQEALDCYERAEQL